ncbi:hypothetical protein [Thioclava sp. GXIMD4215]|uniref:hypothetical protein n=1 Tax=Thioclava sp. GXIMD4215 TaxID=3131928 RepID=UPI00324D7B1A
MRIQLSGFALLACTALVACGGSSSGGGSNGTGGGARLSASEAATVMTQYDEAIAAVENGDATVATDASGAVSMSGYMGFSIEEEEDEIDALGKLSMDVDFDNGTVSGTADNFALFDTSDEANPVKVSNVSGALTVDGTVTSAAIDASATGHLSDGDGGADFDLTMTGNVYEQDDALMALGDVEGTFTTDEGVTETTGGGFVAYED